MRPKRKFKKLRKITVKKSPRDGFGGSPAQFYLLLLLAFSLLGYIMRPILS
jgi:hypothetical protein